MTFNYFNDTINTIIELYDEKTAFDKSMEKVFGGDTQIISDIFNKNIDKLINNLEKELNDKDEWIDYLIFEVLMSPTKEEGFNITLENGEELKANTKTIWFILTGEKIA